MNLRDPRLWIGVVTGAAVLMFGIVDTGRVSPGEVATVHGRLSDLDGGENCSACHGGFRSDMVDACLECHEPIATQLDGGRGLHGILEDSLSSRCALCHSDHHGPDFSVVNALSFSLAGIDDVDNFDHASIGYGMSGPHTELDCTECHTHASAAPLPEGAQRYLGLETACASCHDDPHRGTLGVSCADCHVQEDFAIQLALRHDEVLPLVGGHAELDCLACHAEGSPYSLEAERSRRREVTPRSCVECHESPHGAGLDAGIALVSEFSAGNSCAACHVSAHDSFQQAESEVTPLLHGASGFDLDMPHSEQSCEDCHGEPGEDFAQRFPGREALDCAACHMDPHGAQFDQSVVASACIDCHAATHFDPPTFGTELHAHTRLPLEHAHLEVACDACHGKLAGQPRRFRATPSRCEDCHDDSHRGAFDLVSKGLQPLDQGECARCHDARAFDAVDREAFDHSLWAGYSLQGAHAQASCETCHQPRSQPDATGRRFGIIAERHGALPSGEGRVCADCHDDPHLGGFDGAALPAAVEGRVGCLRCHTQDSFRTLPHGFDHGLWTGYGLDGAHGEASCSACHTPLRRAEANGRSWLAALGSSCADCHADPHGGQFAKRGNTDCAACHTPSGRFEADAFDHQRTRFPLDAAHAKVACAACHEPEPFALQTRKEELVRYASLGRECVDCHANPKGGALRRRRGNR